MMFQSTLPMKGVTRPQPQQQIRGTLKFQSTLPMKGVTNGRIIQFERRSVSIHTPNEGSDLAARAASAGIVGFNPHSQ